VALFTAFADEIPGGAADAAVATVAGPASAVLPAGIVSLAARMSTAAGMGGPHVIGHRRFKVAATDVTEPIVADSTALVRLTVLAAPVSRPLYDRISAVLLLLLQGTAEEAGCAGRRDGWAAAGGLSIIL
jgi:hypothetical protein